MFRNTLLLFIFLVLGTAGATFAMENSNDNDCVLPGETFSGHETAAFEPFRGDVFDFPTSADTWTMTYYPYWWNTGDTVYGTYVTTETIDHAEISLSLTRNSLVSGGHCDIEFRIDGTAVGTFTITEASGLGPILESFDFTSIPAGPHELRYYETNTVAPGCGSVDMNEAAGINSVSFSCLALEQTTWGAIKAAI
jgi:hypothetical protein